jgi:hypothetical protein
MLKITILLSPARWARIGRRRILHAQAVKIPGVFTLPVHGYPLLCGVEHGDGPGAGAFLNTAATVPALFGVNDDWFFPFFRVGHHDIGGADIDTEIAADADIGIKLNSLVGGGEIGYYEDLVIHISNSPFV